MINSQIEPFKPAQRFILDRDGAIVRETDVERLCVGSHAPHQKRGPAIDEALGQLFVQRIGKFLLKRRGFLRPMLRVLQPVWSLRHIGPSPDGRDPGRDLADIALDRIEPRQLCGDNI